MHKELLVRLGEARALLGDELGVADVEVAVDEVADDFDLARDAEVFARSLTKVRGDGGDAVGLVDAELGDGEIRAVEADERDVGAVQRGDEGQVAAAGGEHLAGEQGAHGVGDRVMDVEQVKVVELGDLGHAGGEREVVGRVLEEWIVGDRYLVVADVGVAAG